MAFLGIVFTGFIVGLLARFLKPGRDNMGVIMTTLLGVSGAIVATYVGQALGFYLVGEPAGLLTSVIGAILVLAIAQASSGRRRRQW